MTDDQHATDPPIPVPGDALLLVDVQRDFLPGGALAVTAGDAVVAPLDRLATLFAARGLAVVATRDWHPPDHISFAMQGGPWPPHCVRETPGAAFADGLALPPATAIVDKGYDPHKDVYSGFDGTDLAALLHARGVRRVIVGGLATDYCVLETVLDARAAGFDVVLLVDAIRPVEVMPGDGAAALQRMLESGAVPLTCGEIR